MEAAAAVTHEIIHALPYFKAQQAMHIKRILKRVGLAALRLASSSRDEKDIFLLLPPHTFTRTHSSKSVHAKARHLRLQAFCSLESLTYTTSHPCSQKVTRSGKGHNLFDTRTSGAQKPPLNFFGRSEPGSGPRSSSSERFNS